MSTIATAYRSSESGHWYTRDGRPVYEVTGANGRIRPCTLRDAREHGLLPGVSSILKMEAAPGLERWKIEQGILSAVTLPKIPEESVDQFVVRALKDSQEQARKAADRGTEVHGAIQGHFEGKQCDPQLWPYVEPVIDWIAQRYGLAGWEAEQSFGHELGYGGKIDLRRPQIIMDFKGKDYEPDKTAKDWAFPNHCMQLVAYADGSGYTKPDCVSVFFCRNKPGIKPVVREWDDAEIVQQREAFRLLLRLWQIRRDYDPSFTRQEAA